MDTVELSAPDGPLPALLARPAGAGPWPGVVVVHDVLGLGTDLEGHVAMLADHGYLAIAPDLFSRGRARCMRAACGR